MFLYKRFGDSVMGRFDSTRYLRRLKQQLFETFLFLLMSIFILKREEKGLTVVTLFLSFVHLDFFSFSSPLLTYRYVIA